TTASGSKESTPADDSNGRLPGVSAFDEFKQDLFKPFESLRSKNAVDNMLIMRTPLPASTPREPTPREREELEKKRNWMFADPNELYSDPKWNDTAKELKEKKSTSPGEKEKPRTPVGAYTELLNAAGLGKGAISPEMMGMYGLSQSNAAWFGGFNPM